MKVSFLGTGTATPEADRGPTSTLIENGDDALLVDAGSGTLQKLEATGLGLAGVDALLLSHDHLDHFADVLPLLFSLYVPGVERAAPLRIIASPQTHARIRAVQEAFGDWLRPEDDLVRYEEIEPGNEFQCQGFHVRTMRPKHADASIGFRLQTERGYSVAIPGDTGWTDALVPFVSDTDLAIVECSVPDELAMPTHLSPRDLCRLVDRANPDALAIVHRYPSVRDTDIEAIVSADWSGHVFIPADGEQYEVGCHERKE